MESSSQVSDRAAEPSWSEELAATGAGKTVAARELEASSSAGAQVDCAAADVCGVRVEHDLRCRVG